MTTDATADLTITEATAVRGRRKQYLIVFAAIVIILVVGLCIWSVFFRAHEVDTENAYTAAEVTQVTPLISGAVKTMAVTDTQIVRAGEVLLTIDATDMQLALNASAASLAQAERQVAQLLANDQNFAGQGNARDADIDAAEADMRIAEANRDKARIDARRRRALAEPGAVSGQEVTDAETALRQTDAVVLQARARWAAAKAARIAAAGARAANAALVQNTTVDTNPLVLAARARFEQAQTDLARTIIRAPSDGVVDQRTVEIGQRVSTGQRLMIIVPMETVYVNANFKEGQLCNVHRGQRAQLTSDIYGSKIVYHGRVLGFAGGTGSAFSTIPAQNATGNWIKVVQRLPVRIELDPQELRNHPLRVGLSMHATIDLDSSTKPRTADRTIDGSHG